MAPATAGARHGTANRTTTATEMRRTFVLVYVLVLLTQLPHIWAAYAALEQPGLPFAQWTALGAALAFELSIGLFTLRVVTGARRAWTKRGLGFFILASIVANGYYYRWWPQLFGWLMPIFATLALPLSLALFAEEFANETKAEAARHEREQRRIEREAAPQAAASVEPATVRCGICGAGFSHRNGLNAHQRVHHRTNGHSKEA